MSKKSEKPMKDLPVENADAIQGGAFAGINSLIKVTQLGAQNANNQAMEGATKQRTKP